MSPDIRYRVNSPQVIGEVVNDEAVIVNLHSGFYYSTMGAGGRVWQMVARGASFAEMLESLSTQYDGDTAAIAEALARLIAELQEEELISVAPPGDRPDERWDDGATSPAPAPRLPFKAPVLEKFTDMENLLLLDPIHEADEIGWPHPAKGNDR